MTESEVLHRALVDVATADAALQRAHDFLLQRIETVGFTTRREVFNLLAVSSQATVRVEAYLKSAVSHAGPPATVRSPAPALDAHTRDPQISPTVSAAAAACPPASIIGSHGRVTTTPIQSQDVGSGQHHSSSDATTTAPNGQAITAPITA